MTTFSRSISLPVSAKQAFDWHEREGAFGRLTPPWERVELLHHEGGIQNGARVTVKVRPFGPIGFTAVYRHVDYRYGEQFVDIQEKGPFRSWRHEHRFETTGDNQCRLVDHIEFEGPPYSGKIVLDRLARMFEYRHAITLGDLQYEASYGAVQPKTVLISGASGLVGRALTARLKTRGHHTKFLSRRPAPDTTIWNPAMDRLPEETLNGVDAVIHLAGEPIAQRWTPAVKERILNSRVHTAGLLTHAILRQETPPSYLSASGINYYGTNGGPFSETSPAGTGFLADICHSWEGAAQPLIDQGIPTSFLRTGVVISARGGALAKMLPAFKLGIAGPLGSGNQQMSWVGLDDLVDQYLFALEHPELAGGFNCVAPAPISNAAFTRTLGTILHRPTVLPVPEPLLRLLFGEMADETVLADLAVTPARLTQQHVAWRHPDLPSCLRHELGRATAPPAAS